jgi:predicted RNA-binding protein
MYYLFVVNDLDYGNIVISAEEIVSYLFNNNVWLLNNNTPNIKRIHKDDQVLVYIAGHKRRYVYAKFRIESEPQQNNLVSLEPKYLRLNSIFKLSVKISCIQMLKRPVNFVKEVRDNLDFITNKEYWGLFFRHATRELSAKDYNYICNLAGVSFDI